MNSNKKTLLFLLQALILITGILPAYGLWVQRGERFAPRGPWLWALPRELPRLYREFNGIDFGHAHIAETLLNTQDPQEVEKARLEVLDFIFSSPEVPPDEEQVAPTFTRMVWELQRTFTWAHTFHRTLYDLFAADQIEDKQAAYKTILNHFLQKPEAITNHPLDLHGRLWNFPESKAFRDKFPKFNTQIWAYHWLQAATYDVQLMGDSGTQRELMSKAIDFYHQYLKNPPTDWRMMPMMVEVAPVFSKRFPEAAAIFDNLHMLHDNVDDVLSRPDLYPSYEDKRRRIMDILDVYLHRNHLGNDGYADYHMKEEASHHRSHTGEIMGARPPSVQEAIGIRLNPQHGIEVHSEATSAGPPAEH
jgi:hypothetical protein